MVAIMKGRCEIFVEGFAMECPFCHVIVKSGEHHVCEIGDKPSAEKKSPPKK